MLRTKEMICNYSCSPTWNQLLQFNLCCFCEHNYGDHALLNRLMGWCHLHKVLCWVKLNIILNILHIWLLIIYNILVNLKHYLLIFVNVKMFLRILITKQLVFPTDFYIWKKITIFYDFWLAITFISSTETCAIYILVCYKINVKK